MFPIPWFRFITSGDLKGHVPKMVECSHFWTSNGRPHSEDILLFMDLAIVDALPSPGVNPLDGSPKCNCGKRDSEGAPGFQL